MEEEVPVVRFRKGERKDAIAAEHLERFTKPEGVLFIGKEKTPVFRTERRRNAETGVGYPWLVLSTAMVNHFYVYCVDRDFSRRTPGRFRSRVITEGVVPSLHVDYKRSRQ